MGIKRLGAVGLGAAELRVNRLNDLKTANARAAALDRRKWFVEGRVSSMREGALSAKEKKLAVARQLKESRYNTKYFLPLPKRFVNLHRIRRGDVFVSIGPGGWSHFVAKMIFSKVSHNGVFLRDLQAHNELKAADYKIFQGGKLLRFDLLEQNAKFKVLRWRNWMNAGEKEFNRMVADFAFNAERILELKKRYDALLAPSYSLEQMYEKVTGKKIEFVHNGLKNFFTCSEHLAYAASPPDWAIKELGLKPVKLLPPVYSKHLDDIHPGIIERNLVKSSVLEVVYEASNWDFGKEHVPNYYEKHSPAAKPKNPPKIRRWIQGKLKLE